MTQNRITTAIVELKMESVSYDNENDLRGRSTLTTIMLSCNLSLKINVSPLPNYKVIFKSLFLFELLSQAIFY